MMSFDAVARMAVRVFLGLAARAVIGLVIIACLLLILWFLGQR